MKNGKKKNIKTDFTAFLLNDKSERKEQPPADKGGDSADNYLSDEVSLEDLKSQKEEVTYWGYKLPDTAEETDPKEELERVHKKVAHLELEVARLKSENARLKDLVAKEKEKQIKVIKELEVAIGKVKADQDMTEAPTLKRVK